MAVSQLLRAHQLRNSEEFNGMVEAAALKVALDTLTMANPPDTVKQRASENLARSVMSEASPFSNKSFVSRFVVLCAADDAIRTAAFPSNVLTPASVTDTAIITLVRNAWYMVSGETE